MSSEKKKTDSEDIFFFSEDIFTQSNYAIVPWFLERNLLGDGKFLSLPRANSLSNCEKKLTNQINTVSDEKNHYIVFVGHVCFQPFVESGRRHVAADVS